MDDCVFCQIVAGTSPAVVVREWPDAIAFLPHHPCTGDRYPEGYGHILVAPRVHVVDAIEDPIVSGVVAARAAELGQWLRAEHGWQDMNLIANAGRIAGQTVDHYHKHLVRRQLGDRLLMPWPQRLQEAHRG